MEVHYRTGFGYTEKKIVYINIDQIMFIEKVEKVNNYILYFQGGTSLEITASDLEKLKTGEMNNEINFKK